MSDTEYSGALVPSGQPPGDFSRDDLALLDDVFDGFEKSPAGLPMEAVEAEFKQIADFRQRDRRAYFKDDKLQARERELLERKAQGSSELPPELLDEWANSGGSELRLKTAQDRALVALETLSYPDQRDLQESFDRLPRRAQTESRRRG